MSTATQCRKHIANKNKKPIESIKKVDPIVETINHSFSFSDSVIDYL